MHQDGEASLIISRGGAGGLSAVNRQQGPVTELLTAPEHAGFITFTVRRDMLPMCCAAVSVGAVPAFFTKFLRGLVRAIRDKWGYLVLRYLDDFPIAHSGPGGASKRADVAEARLVLARIIRRLWIVSVEGKRCWAGVKLLYDIGLHVYTVYMCGYVAD